VIVDDDDDVQESSFVTDENHRAAYVLATRDRRIFIFRVELSRTSQPSRVSFDSSCFPVTLITVLCIESPASFPAGDGAMARGAPGSRM
jgi:hypothetical protein